MVGLVIAKWEKGRNQLEIVVGSGSRSGHGEREWGGKGGWVISLHDNGGVVLHVM